MYAYFERLLNERGLTVSEVSKQTGIPKSSLSEWKSGKYKDPKPDRLKVLADFFGVPVDYFVTGQMETVHYEDPLTAEVAQRLKDDDDLRLLFSAAKDARKETLLAVYDILLALKKRERNED